MKIESRKLFMNSNIPFYALPARRKSSAEIIREAKADIRIMAACRPSTPFGRSGVKNEIASDDSRPSSSISHASYMTESPRSRPLSSIRLKPLRAKSAGHREPVENLHLEPTVVKTPLIDKRTGCKMFQRASSFTSSSIIESTDSKSSLSEITHGSTLKSDPEENSSVSKAIQMLESNINKTSTISSSTVAKDKIQSVNSGWLPKVHSSDKKSNTSERVTEISIFEEEIKLFIGHLEELQIAGVKDNQVEALDTVSRLYHVFEESNMFTVSFPSRFSLSKVLFRMLNSHTPTLTLRISKLLLEMKIREKNLSNVCKVLYKICYEERVIVEFLECGILGPFIESVKSITPEENLEAVKYSVCLICRLATKELLLDALGISKCHEIILLHLEHLNNIENCSRNEEHTYILVKIITGLRFLSENNAIFHSMLSNGSCKLLMKTLVVNETDVQTLKATVRLLSMIANTNEGCDAILACDNACDIFAKFIIFKSSSYITLQVAFIVGCLIAHKSEIAQQFYAIIGFINVLHSHLDAFVSWKIEKLNRREPLVNNQLSNSGDGTPDEVDLMIKVIRILANMCLCSDVGHSLSKEGQFVICMLKIIKIYQAEDMGDVSEPLICVLIAMNNLTYFMNPETEVLPRITETIAPLLDEKYDLDVRLETCNVFQNLTRFPQVRSFIFKNQMIPAFVSLLEEYHHEVALSAYAIVMNLLLDKVARGSFYKEQGVAKLLHKLHLCLGRDWKTAALLCQILWNYCIFKEEEGDVPGTPLTQLEIQHLIKVLQYSTGNNIVLDTDDETTKEDWELAFCPIGKKLIELLQLHLVKT